MKTWNVCLEYWFTTEAETEEEAIESAFEEFRWDTHPEMELGSVIECED